MQRVGEHPVPAGPLAVRWLGYELGEQRAGVATRARVRLANAGAISVRAEVRDQAGNVSQVQVEVSPNSDIRPIGPARLKGIVLDLVHVQLHDAATGAVRNRGHTLAVRFEGFRAARQRPAQQGFQSPP
jgi:hypothetical protein